VAGGWNELMQLVVRNGIVVTAAGAYEADIGIEGGCVSQIGGHFSRTIESINAKGCLIIPGGVDVHTHLDAPGFGTNTADDFYSGTVAAACGGTTTIVDFCAQDKGQSLAEALGNWHTKARGKAVIDYGFHIIVTDMTEAVYHELAGLPDLGITSFKLFMAYKGAQMVDDLALTRALDQAKTAGALVMVHAENGDAVEFLRAKFVREGKLEPKFHATSRPPRVEAEATARAIALAEIVGTSIYIVHLTCAESLEEVMNARRRGIEVLAETCTHYLYSTHHDLERLGFEGAKWVFTPPARTADDQEILWRALADHRLQAVSSDHAAWSYEKDKHLGRNDFTKIPNGAPGIEERLTMVYQGVNEGRISLSRFVDLTATTPARIFGLFPKKGTIAIGSDADLVIWDPHLEATISQGILHHGVDYTLYEGRRVVGRPRTVLLRGEVIVLDGDFVGQAGMGQYLKRAKYQSNRL
jgi:dihydropyrimidinase